MLACPMADGKAAAGARRRRRRGRPGYDRESLLAVAVAVFNERGYDGTSMEDLSLRLGIAKSSIYHHVDSKEDLLTPGPGPGPGRAVLGGATQARTADAPQSTGWNSWSGAACAVLADRLPYVTLLLRARGNTATERRALSRRREFDQIVADLVKEAERDGDIRPDIDPADYGPTAVRHGQLGVGVVPAGARHRPGTRSIGDDLADAVCAMAFGWSAHTRRGYAARRAALSADRPDIKLE